MTKDLITIVMIFAVSAALMFTAGCENEAQSVAAFGALTGAGIGHMAGGDSESTLIGAAVGGAAGYMIGNEVDKQKTQAEMYCMRQEMNTVLVKVTNSNGSIIQVPLKKCGVGYVGTMGEYYNTLPNEDQLRPVYGF